MSATLIRGGRLIDPAAGRDGDFDLLIEGGVIATVKAPGVIAAGQATTVIDARDCWVLPGLIDVHVHLRDPGFPEKETIASGLRAAAAGGFTTVAAMANTSPVNDSPEICRYMTAQAKSAAGARLVPVSAVSKGLRGALPVDYEAMANAGARLFSDDGIPVDDEILLRNALERVSQLGFVVSLHEEDRAAAPHWAVNAGPVAERLGLPGMPAEGEAGRVRRDLGIAMGADAPVHIAHISTAESLALVCAARQRGVAVTCEVTPHHFSLEEHRVFHCGPNAKMNPPLRSRADIEALRTAMAFGAIDMIATDHAPHDPASKQIAPLGQCFAGDMAARSGLNEEQRSAFGRAANGVVGLETAVGLAMQLVHQSVLTPSRLVEMMSVAPAKLLRLERGSLRKGAAADVTLLDPQCEWRVEAQRFLSRSRNTPFEGMTLKGKVMLTIVDGVMVHDARRTAR